MKLRDFSIKKDVKNIITFIFLLLFMLVGLKFGYAYLRVELGVKANTSVAEYDPDLRKRIMHNAVIDNTPSKFVEASFGIDFSLHSSRTNGTGVYIRSGTENDTYPIYYYRGAVTNNNVIFANFCWLIVRTTEKGGTKLIYNGVPSSGKCTDKNPNIGDSAFNSWTLENYTYSYQTESPTDVGYMYGPIYEVSRYNSTVSLYWGSSVSYNSSTKIYTLNSRSTGTATSMLKSSRRYTCRSSTTYTCDSVSYLFQATSSDSYYLTFSNGKNLATAKEDMFSNLNDSVIKKKIDSWYANNMTEYTDYLEDAVWCNDRSTAVGPLHSESSITGTMTTYFAGAALNHSGGGVLGSTSDDMNYVINAGRKFISYNPGVPNPALKDATACPRGVVDRFTVSSANGNGNLTYPVGLITADEVIAGGSNGNYYVIAPLEIAFLSYNYENNNYWTMTPNMFGIYDTYVHSVTDRLYTMNMANAAGGGGWGTARPCIVLKNGAQIYTGDGTKNNPFIIVYD